MIEFIINFGGGIFALYLLAFLVDLFSGGKK